MADDVTEPESNEDVKAATIAVLQGGDALTYVVGRDAAGWVVGATFPCKGYGDGGKSFAGHTGIDPTTSNDPRDMAARLVAQAKAHAEKMEAFFAGLVPVSEPVQAAPASPDLPDQETNSAPGAAVGDAPELTPLRAVGLAAENEDDPTTLDDAIASSGDNERGGSSSIPDDADTGSGPLSGLSDLHDAGEAEASVPAHDETLHAEVADDPPPPEAFAGTTILAGDPLESWRSQRIGDVTRIALEKDPPIDDNRLQWLRSYAAGVEKGSVAADPTLAAELQTVEADVQLSGRIQAYAKQRTRALLLGDREFIEDFNADAGWP